MEYIFDAHVRKLLEKLVQRAAVGEAIQSGLDVEVLFA